MSHNILDAKVFSSRRGQPPRNAAQTFLVVFSVLTFLIGLFLSPLLVRISESSVGSRTQTFKARLFSTDFAPARSALAFKEVKFTGGPAFHPNGTMYIPKSGHTAYSGTPRPEVDSAWDALLLGRYFSVTAEEAQSALGPDYRSYYSPIHSTYLIGLDVFHTLHCVNELRKAFAPEYYGPMMQLHREHCLEQIRQYVMCAGDITPVPTRFFPGLKDPHDTEDKVGGDYVASDVVHTCRDFDRLRDWLTSRYEKGTVRWEG